MRIAVIGAGAVGGYFGGRLAAAGHEVALVARGETLAALRARGLRVDSPQGDLEIRPWKAIDDPAEVGPVDLVLVAVKAWQVPEVAPASARWLARPPACCRSRTASRPPASWPRRSARSRSWAGCARSSACSWRPGHIRHLGVEPSIDFGELGRPPTERVRRVRRLLEGAGIQRQDPG